MGIFKISLVRAHLTAVRILKLIHLAGGKNGNCLTRGWWCPVQLAESSFNFFFGRQLHRLVPISHAIL